MSLVGAGIRGLRLSESILIETMTLREPSGVTPLRVWKLGCRRRGPVTATRVGDPHQAESVPGSGPVATELSVGGTVLRILASPWWLPIDELP